MIFGAPLPLQPTVSPVVVSFQERMLSATSTTFQESEALHDLKYLCDGLNRPGIDFETGDVERASPPTAFSSFFFSGLFSEVLHETADGPPHPDLGLRKELRETQLDEKEHHHGSKSRVYGHYVSYLEPVDGHFYYQETGYYIIDLSMVLRPPWFIRFHDLGRGRYGRGKRKKAPPR